MSEAFFVVGRILAPWGVRGEVKIEVLTDYPERFAPKARVFMKGVPLEVERARRVAKHAILKLAGVDTRNDAEALRNQLLEVPESDLMPLQPEEYFEHQIIGLQLYTIEGVCLGRVEEILRTGSNDVYVVREGTKEYLIPAIAEVVRTIDVPGGRITIEPLPGLLE